METLSSAWASFSKISFKSVCCEKIFRRRRRKILLSTHVNEFSWGVGSDEKVVDDVDEPRFLEKVDPNWFPLKVGS